MFSAKRYLFCLILLFIVSAGAFIYILVSVNPQSAGLIQLSAFYAATFGLCMSGFAVAGYAARVFLFRNNPLHTFARISLRQAFLLSLFVTVLLILQSLRAVTLMALSFLIISLTLLEAAFLSR